MSSSPGAHDACGQTRRESTTDPMTDRSTYDPGPGALELPIAIATMLRERWRPSVNRASAGGAANGWPSRRWFGGAA